MSAATIESAAPDADAAPLDLLLTDTALGVLNRAPAGRSRTRAWQVGRRKRCIRRLPDVTEEH